MYFAGGILVSPVHWSRQRPWQGSRGGGGGGGGRLQLQQHQHLQDIHHGQTKILGQIKTYFNSSKHPRSDKILGQIKTFI